MRRFLICARCRPVNSSIEITVAVNLLVPGSALEDSKVSRALRLANILDKA